MGINFLMFDTGQAGENRNLRLDYRFAHFLKNKLPFKSIPFRKVVTELSNGKDIGKQHYVNHNSSDIIYPTVNNFRGGEFNYTDITFVHDEFPIPRKLSTDDIIISRSGTVGLTYVWDQQTVNRIFGREITAIPSGYLIIVKVDTSKAVPLFIQYFFSSQIMKKYFYVFGVGKTQKNIAQPEILDIPFPVISLKKQKSIINKARPFEEEIKTLKSKLKSQEKIINEVFTAKFKFNIAEFEHLKKVTTINKDFRSFSNNVDLRFSFKFHNRAGEFIVKSLRAMTTKKIKDYLSEPITLGKGISPDEYDEDGAQYYVSMADIKNWKFETEEAKKVSFKFYEDNAAKHIVLNDIILARSGEGTIGKVALIDSEEFEGVYADFTMRIKLKKYNPLFAYYYFRTNFFQYLIYTYKKGLGNNTNIFPSQIQELPLLDIGEDQQQRIVDLIKAQIDEQHKIELEIQLKKNEINKIIDRCLA